MISKLKLRSYFKDYECIVGMLEYQKNAKFLDLGCGDGRMSQMFSGKVGTTLLTGIDIKDWKVPFEFLKWDIEKGLPLNPKTFDVITATHVIEHLSDTDLFTSECYRVLKTGGYLLVATPNMASGRIIVELLLDRQPNLAHVSNQFIIRGDPGQEWRKSVGNLHKRLFTIEGLRKLLVYHGFKIESVRGSGYGAYYPLGKLLRGRYASNIIVKARK